MKPAFRIPAFLLSCLLVATLVGCGGGGGGGVSGGSSPTAGAPPAGGAANNPGQPIDTPTVPEDPQASVTPYKVFAVVPGEMLIASFSNANPLPGSAVSARTIRPFAGIVGMPGKHLAYDAASDALYATIGASIIVIDHASKASGDVAPSRVITVPSAVVKLSSYLVYDKDRDVLWLGGEGTKNGMLVKIGRASTARGAVTPDKVYQLREPRAFSIDTQRNLVYALESTIGVHVYDLATLQDTTVLPDNQQNQPTRDMFFPGLNIGSDIALDMANNRIYAVDGFGAMVVVDNASASSGAVAYAKFILSMPQSVTFDPATDRLYVGGGSNDVTIFNQASRLSMGSPVPAVSVFGPRVTPGSSAVWGITFP
ncbi:MULTISPECIES: hypothetical protein [unclassified Variovorax]|uniref:YncE family protein n=1 Tax=unclassified Variovorax TaxID=663243 RepID=UPI002578BE46|nr:MULTISPECIES: hypothetical protein [unclassified Variovorax]MDM0087171.1 hypothetical protein [Variovorax sp. J22G40]MDM0144572.1 hypothetical protein [Variovorax sp. J2P1-31]